MKSKENSWIPAFASMTRSGGLPFELAHVHSVHISLYFASPRGEGFPPPPKETLIFIFAQCLVLRIIRAFYKNQG